MRLRIRLAKLGLARFLSHLDFQRVVERGLRRAELPLAFTQGFNPHPRISYASALATGTSSEGEFIDVDLTEPVEPEAFVSRANAALPADVRLLEARPAPEGGESLMALVNAAEYRLTLQGADEEALRQAVARFLEAEQVVVTREGPAGSRSVDIRPHVYSLAVEGPGELRALVQTGSAGNVRPDEVVAGLIRCAPDLAGVELALAHRLMLYRRDPETGICAEPWSL
ncbi:TIGR03936 family radical SAM-associated protein [Symbiobacterium thermophilum]|uniref:TIGR03936 family radical SAM-associated protein n=1 Tax=Symbiobacterium thermophilum TaxID=2734 RepID=UPI0023529DBD|nr:TIGR03936 family radical SAM-associated protein [Symbiobacterium thermophilum]